MRFRRGWLARAENWIDALYLLDQRLIYSTRDSVARLNPRLPVALRTADSPHVIELTKSTAQPAGDSNLVFLSQQLARFGAGMQAAEAHGLRTAEESSTRFDAELWRISQGQKSSDRTVQGKKQPRLPRPNSK